MYVGMKSFQCRATGSPAVRQGCPGMLAEKNSRLSLSGTATCIHLKTRYLEYTD